MTASKKAVTLARVFSKYIRVSLDADGKYLVGIPFVWKKPRAEVRQGLCGRGNDFESACEDFLKEANGLLVSDDPKKEVVVFIL